MTWFEARAFTVLWVAKILKVRMRDLYDSYPYNPLSRSEVHEAYQNYVPKPFQTKIRQELDRSNDENSLDH